jgi:hypothetical protein
MPTMFWRCRGEDAVEGPGGWHFDRGSGGCVRHGGAPYSILNIFEIDD